MKKVWTLFLALCLLISCTAMAENANLYGYEEPITLKVGRALTDIDYFGGETIDDNSWIDMYAEHGIMTDLLYHVDSTQEATKLATSIMSGNYPDIISIKASKLNDYVNYADGGVIADITDLIDQYASDELKAYLNSDGGLAMGCLKVNGRIYGLPKMSSSYDKVSLMFIRKDWLDNLGLAVPTTMEELKTVAHAFTYNDPDGNGANDTYGLVLSGVDVVSSGWGDTSLIFDAFGANIGPDGMAIIENGENTVAWGGANAEGMKKALTWLHELYEDGSLVKDFITMTGNSVNEEVGAGRAGIFCAPMWGAMGPIYDAKKVDPDAHIISVAIPNGLEEGLSKTYKPVAFDGVYCISSQCKNPEALIKLMNLSVKYLCYPENTEEYYRYYGDYTNYTGWKMALTDTLEPLKNYDCYKAMMPALEKRDPSSLNPYQLDIYNSLVTYIDAVANGTYDPQDAAFQGPIGRYTVYGDPQGAYAAIHEMVQADRFVPSAFNAALTEEQAEVSATLKKMTVETIVKIITGAEEVEYYDTFLKSWMINGGEDYVAEAQAWYESQK